MSHHWKNYLTVSGSEKDLEIFYKKSLPYNEVLALRGFVNYEDDLVSLNYWKSKWDAINVVLKGSPPNDLEYEFDSFSIVSDAIMIMSEENPDLTLSIKYINERENIIGQEIFKYGNSPQAQISSYSGRLGAVYSVMEMDFVNKEIVLIIEKSILSRKNLWDVSGPRDISVFEIKLPESIIQEKSPISLAVKINDLIIDQHIELIKTEISQKGSLENTANIYLAFASHQEEILKMIEMKKMKEKMEKSLGSTNDNKSKSKI